MLNLSKAFENMIWINGALPRLIWKDGRAFDPLHMFLEVTYHCNLRCNFCEYLDIIKGEIDTVGPVKEYTTDELKRAIDEFPRRRLITFSGGETLVRKDFPEIIAYASEHHRTHIISNGVLINEKIARHYIDLAPRWVWQNGLVLVGISMEGDEERHDQVVQRKGSWRKTIEGIRHMVRLRKESGKKFPKFNLKLVVTGETVHAMIDHMHLARDLGVDLVNFMAEHDLVRHSGTLTGNPDKSRITIEQPKPAGVDPDVLRKQLTRCFELAKELGLQIRTTPANLPIDEFVRHYSNDRTLSPEEYACEGAWARLQKTAEGRYSVCPYYRVGTSKDLTLKQVWNGEEFKQFRRDIARDHVYAGCNGCCGLKYTGPRKYGLTGVEH